MESHPAVQSTIVRPIKVQRIAAGLTQAELADAAGISRKTVSNLERGCFNPGRRTAKALAVALGVTEVHLFGVSDG